jgi:hypothetical protein
VHTLFPTASQCRFTNPSLIQDEDLIAQQAALANAKFGGIHKKNPLVSQDKKKFDSADYFKEHENLKEAAGLSEGTKQNQEETKKE